MHLPIEFSRRNPYISKAGAKVLRLCKRKVINNRSPLAFKSIESGNITETVKEMEIPSKQWNTKLLQEQAEKQA